MPQNDLDGAGRGESGYKNLASLHELSLYSKIFIESAEPSPRSLQFYPYLI